MRFLPAVAGRPQKHPPHYPSARVAPAELVGPGWGRSAARRAKAPRAASRGWRRLCLRAANPLHGSMDSMKAGEGLLGDALLDALPVAQTLFLPRVRPPYLVSKQSRRPLLHAFHDSGSRAQVLRLDPRAMQELERVAARNPQLQEVPGEARECFGGE